MAVLFQRSMRAVEREGSARRVLSLVGSACFLLALWIAWFVSANISVYEVTERGRVEVDSAAHPVTALVPGRVVETRLLLGREVENGEVLVELDSDVQRLARDEQKRRLLSIAAQLSALHAEVATYEESLQSHAQATRVVIDEAGSLRQEAETTARIAEQEASRSRVLRKDGYVSEGEYLRAEGEAGKGRAVATAMTQSVNRLEWDQKIKQSDRRAHVQELKRQAAELSGALSAGETTLARLESELDRRFIRAPTRGRIGEMANIRVGAVVQSGDRLAAVVPSGELRVIGEFLPATALGRVKPGQSARIRLSGFPWLQYGSIRAEVQRVADEVRNDRVRVELAVVAENGSPIPLQHGLPGSIEVEVEHTTPMTLVLRTLSRRLTQGGSP